MSSQSRNRDYEVSRTKEDMSNYRSSPYASKSRGEIDNRKRDSYSSRGEGSGGMGEKHREAPYSSKSSRRSIDERKDSYISSKRERDVYSNSGSREIYPKGGREREYSFESRERDPYSSRGRGHSSRGNRESYSSRGNKEPFSSRGSFVSSRGGRDSFSSRGNYGGNRGGRESFSSRGNYGSHRGSREFFPRGNFGSGRGNKDSFSRGSYGSMRGNRDSFMSRGSLGNRGGRDSYSSRGSYGPPRGGRDHFSRGTRGSTRGFRGSSHRGLRSDNFISQFDNRAQLELTKKLVASVLEDSEGGHYRHEKPYRMKEFKQEGRAFYPRESDRPYKEPSRSFPHHSSFSHGDKMIKRERSSSSGHFDKDRFMYSEKPKMRIRDKFREAPSKRIHAEEENDDDEDEDDEDERPPLKHLRLAKRDKFHGSGPNSNNDNDFEERSSSYSPTREEELPLRRGSGSKERESKRRSRKSVEHSRLVERDSKPTTPEERKRSEERDVEEEGERGRIKVKRKFSRDDDLEEEFIKRRRRKTSPSGMQVTVGSDGERAVNSEGHVKSRISSGKIFVDLQCPHCPGQKSITFKEYRYHLDSRGHRMKIEKLTYKHSIVLRRIRLQQRTEQKEIEEKWEQENPDEFKTTQSRYCSSCKLAFKCLPEDNSSKGIAEHNASRLHKVQHRYLYPHCDMCRMSFPSRLVYEYHIASIRHLRMWTMSRENGRERSVEASFRDEGNLGDREEIDLTNFITMDSVGEDEEVGSEHGEITGNPEDVEKAEEDAKEGEEEEEEEEEEETRATRGDEKKRNSDGEDDMEEELDHEIDVDLEDDASEEGEKEIYGKEYLVPMDAFFCKLCHKVIRVDTPLGESALDKHCASSLHIENYNFLESEDYMQEHGENFDENLEEEEHFDEGGEEEEEEEPEEEEHLDNDSKKPAKAESLDDERGDAEPEEEEEEEHEADSALEIDSAVNGK